MTEIFDGIKYYTISEIAERTKLSHMQIWRQVNNRKLMATKIDTIIGKVWYISEQDFTTWNSARRRKAGRPKGS